MLLNNTYHLLKKDLSGSTAKNRFRNELLWGVYKIYLTYLNDQREFFVIFDYACDIELGYDDELFLYQIKTKAIQKGNFTLNELVKIEKGSKQSILSTLLQNDVDDQIRELNIVANKNLSCSDSVLSKVENLCFDKLSNDEKITINDHLNTILGKTANFNKYHFILSNIPLVDSSKSLLGETVTFLDQVADGSTRNAIYFYQYLKDKVEEKATYELHTKNLSETIVKKGITREEISIMIEHYKKTAIDYLTRVVEMIDKLQRKVPYLSYLGIKGALSKFANLGFDSILVTNNIRNVRNELESKEMYKGLCFEDLVILLENNTLFEGILGHPDKLCIVCIALREIEEAYTGE